VRPTDVLLLHSDSSEPLAMRMRVQSELSVWSQSDVKEVDEVLMGKEGLKYRIPNLSDLFEHQS